ncbi:MAG: hypothetical protein A2X08_00990 [Bacteroidetes bacterium GWA2_32_17]|nr:MAG: hypothetical protein A2X08_00990 [Bacteroidetes bacterium GWA2_32_17]
MKHFILLLILLITLYKYGYSQCLSIELSIEWKSENNVLKIIENQDLICVPYLTITYRNNTEKNIYLLKTINNISKYPIISSTISLNTKMDLSEQVEKHLTFFDEEFNVYIGKSCYFGGGWEILGRNIDRNSEYEGSVIQNVICDIYEILKTQELLNNINDKYKLSCFNYSNKQILTYNEASKFIYENHSIEFYKNEVILNYKDTDITNEKIINELKNNFVFLKEKQVYSEQFNLIGFYISGGNFNFTIEDSVSYGFVYLEPIFSEEEKRWNFQKKNLPEIINGYYLYKGNFNTNSVYLEIDDKK